MIPMTPADDWTRELVDQLRAWRQWFETSLSQAANAPLPARPPSPTLPALISPNLLAAQRPGGKQPSSADEQEVLVPEEELGPLGGGETETHSPTVGQLATSFIRERERQDPEYSAENLEYQAPLTTVHQAQPIAAPATFAGPSGHAQPRSLYRIARELARERPSVGAPAPSVSVSRLPPAAPATRPVQAPTHRPQPFPGHGYHTGLEPFEGPELELGDTTPRPQLRPDPIVFDVPAANIAIDREDPGPGETGRGYGSSDEEES